MDQIETFEQYRDLPNHPGAVATRRWDALRRCHVMHLANADDALRLLRRFAQDHDLAVEVVQNVRPSEVREWFFTELLRVIHNYLASSMTLLDQTRRFMRDYKGTQFQEDYDAKTRHIVEAKVGAVIRGCRNHILHRSPVPFTSRLSFDRIEGTRADVHLSVPALLEWSGWKAEAREYLEELSSDELDVAMLFVEYEALIDELYRWIYGQFSRLHGKDIREHNERLEFLNRAISESYSS